MLTGITQISDARNWSASLISFYSWWNKENRVLILRYTPLWLSLLNWQPLDLFIVTYFTKIILIELKIMAGKHSDRATYETQILLVDSAGFGNITSRFPGPGHA